MGIFKSFSVNYEMYVTLEFFEAALGYGFNSAGYVMSERFYFSILIQNFLVKPLIACIFKKLRIYACRLLV